VLGAPNGPDAKPLGLFDALQCCSCTPPPTSLPSRRVPKILVDAYAHLNTVHTILDSITTFASLSEQERTVENS